MWFGEKLLTASIIWHNLLTENPLYPDKEDYYLATIAYLSNPDVFEVIEVHFNPNEKCFEEEYTGYAEDDMYDCAFVPTDGRMIVISWAYKPGPCVPENCEELIERKMKGLGMP